MMIQISHIAHTVKVNQSWIELLTSFRLMALPYYAGEYCNLARGDSTLCITQLTIELLYQTQWRALCFFIYAFSAMLL